RKIAFDALGTARGIARCGGRSLLFRRSDWRSSVGTILAAGDFIAVRRLAVGRSERFRP
ncbi:MAG: hypothetical protein HY707_04345, partial [Ignavibacteriae bacterium]|nr:hypothetical protein [Ignavibacteriota bacterium]